MTRTCELPLVLRIGLSVLGLIIISPIAYFLFWLLDIIE